MKSNEGSCSSLSLKFQTKWHCPPKLRGGVLKCSTTTRHVETPTLSSGSSIYSQRTKARTIALGIILLSTVDKRMDTTTAPLDSTERCAKVCTVPVPFPLLTYHCLETSQLAPAQLAARRPAAFRRGEGPIPRFQLSCQLFTRNDRLRWCVVLLGRPQ